MVYLVLIIGSILIILASIALAVVIINLLLLLLIRVPYVNTPPSYLKKIISDIEINKGAAIYDLGCGSGDFLRLTDKFEPAICIGLEISPWAYLIATLKNWRFKKVTIKLKDFFKEDLNGADFVYVYLLPRLMHKLAEKLKQELKSGAQILTIGSPLPDWEVKKKIVLDEKINYYAYLYII